jgi:hypothetical protein
MGVTGEAGDALCFSPCQGASRCALGTSCQEIRRRLHLNLLRPPCSIPSPIDGGWSYPESVPTGQPSWIALSLYLSLSRARSLPVPLPFEIPDAGASGTSMDILPLTSESSGFSRFQVLQ